MLMYGPIVGAFCLIGCIVLPIHWLMPADVVSRVSPVSPRQLFNSATLPRAESSFIEHFFTIAPNKRACKYKCTERHKYGQASLSAN